MKGSATTTLVPTTEQSNKSELCQADKDINQQSLSQVLARSASSDLTIEINPGFCRHFSNGFCKQREACQFSHKQENCPNHGFNRTCEGTDCMLRHRQTCKHFLKSRCFFGDKCHFLHPPEANPVMVHSMITELQIKVNEMTRELQDMKEKFSIEKEKPKPPDPTEYIHKIAKNIRIDMNAMGKTFAQSAKEMKNDIRVIKNDIKEECKKDQQDFENHTTMKFVYIKNEIIEISFNLSNMKDDIDILKIDKDECKTALKESKDDITKVAKEIRHDLKDMCRTSKDETKSIIDLVLKEKGEDNQYARAQIVDMERNDYVYADQFLAAVGDMIGCYAVIFHRDRQTCIDGYIKGINLEEQRIYLECNSREVFGSQKIIVFKSIKKQL